MKQTKTVSISLPPQEEEGEKELKHFIEENKEMYQKLVENGTWNIDECYDELKALLAQYKCIDAICQWCWHGDMACGVCLHGQIIEVIEKDVISITKQIKELEGW